MSKVKVKVKNAKSLAKVLKDKPDIIIIEGEFRKAAFRIYATGKVSWIIAISAIAAAIALIFASGIIPILSPGTLSGAGLAAAPAVGILGWPATTAAITIALTGGGVRILNKFRKYKLITRDDNQLVFERK